MDTGFLTNFFERQKKNKNVLSNWEFNAWSKYKNFKNDNNAYLKIKKLVKIKIIKPKFKKRKLFLRVAQLM